VKIPALIEAPLPQGNGLAGHRLRLVNYQDGNFVGAGLPGGVVGRGQITEVAIAKVSLVAESLVGTFGIEICP
jgi:hypothetical protein